MVFFESDQLATLPERESVISMTVYDSIGNTAVRLRVDAEAESSHSGLRDRVRDSPGRRDRDTEGPGELV